MYVIFLFLFGFVTLIVLAVLLRFAQVCKRSLAADGGGLALHSAVIQYRFLFVS